MGIDVIRLQDGSGDAGLITAHDLAPFSSMVHTVHRPPMSIWLTSAAVGRPLFPWWKYGPQVDEDVRKLNNLWAVTSPQSFFDCLFLSQFRRLAGQNFYVIFPGQARTDGWDKLSEQNQHAFSRGQGCVFRLEAEFNGRLAINWVPFSQPQSLVKDPIFDTMWRLFIASQIEDVANSISFFSLADTKVLPQVVNLLIQPNENRSEILSTLVDWFGVYSSPLHPDYSSSAVVYSKEKSTLDRFVEFQKQFQQLVQESRSALLASPTPPTVFRILSRFVAI